MASPVETESISSTSERSQSGGMKPMPMPSKEPPRAFRPDGRKAAVPQDPEVLRHGRLRDPELFLDDGRDGP